MSGHSKWATTKRQKEVVDAKRGRAFTKLANAITLAARQGGGDPESNVTLRYTIDRAREANMPRDNVERAIKRGTGELQGQILEEFVYEAVGSGGSALIIEGVTDKKSRTVSDLRLILGNHDFKLAEVGSQMWQFKRVGTFEVSVDAQNMDQAQLDVIEAGAQDVQVSVLDGSPRLQVLTAPTELNAVRQKVAEKKYAPSAPQLNYRASQLITLSAGDLEKARLAKSDLEANDDVQQIAVNF